MKRILIAGTTGYLGSFVAQEFRRQGHFVRALARSPEKLDRLDPSPDEIVQCEITRPETLEHVCNGIDVVFSSIGITKQKDGLTFRDVDYQGNKNLLDVALRAGVQKFIYISVFNGPDLPHLDIVKAHEDFVEELKSSGINFVVLRPTGYFSDMSEFLEMAKKGRIYLIGKGSNRMNPIHGADLAECCVGALDKEKQEIDVGGPEVMTYREIAELAFRTIGSPARITAVPVWIMKAAVTVTKLFNKHQGELLAFFITAMTSDVVAPSTGTRYLDAHFRKLAGVS
ncbi:MAG: SDR family oxidoreductase [Desulfobacteraceae bacterium]|jgi:uncharacterized protein YbjT (DUF2867 family)